MSVQNNCLTLSLQVGMWAGQRFDRSATKKVTDDAGADASAARVNKHVVPKESLKDITSAGGDLRAHLYENTLPWKGNGDRLVTRRLYDKFMQEHGRLCGVFYAARDAFLTKKYPSALAQAEFRMGNLFDPQDYPTVAELKRKFYVNLDIDAVAESYDQFLGVSEDVHQARVTKAVRDLWDKLLKPLERFAERMGNSDAMFQTTTISNLRDIVDILPALNFTDDPELTRLGEQIRKSLTPYEAKDLRDNPVTRAAVANEAEQILDDMRGFMNAFGGKSDAEA